MSLEEVFGTENEMKSILEQAFSNYISPDQQEQFIAELNNNPEMVYNIGLTPKKFPNLIEHNRLLATEILLKMIDSPEIDDYFLEMISQSTTLASMEAIHMLSNVTKLPEEFVYLYVRQCIVTCREMVNKRQQETFVRLVAVFLQMLLQKKVINVERQFVSIEDFCCDFYWLKEVISLFDLIELLKAREDVKLDEDGVMKKRRKLK